MKKIIFAFTLLSLFLSNPSFSQVTVGPKVGVSYLPFELLHPSGEVESKNIDFMFGVFGKLHLHKKWFMGTSLTYTKIYILMLDDIRRK